MCDQYTIGTSLTVMHFDNSDQNKHYKRDATIWCKVVGGRMLYRVCLVTFKFSLTLPYILIVRIFMEMHIIVQLHSSQIYYLTNIHNHIHCRQYGNR